MGLPLSPFGGGKLSWVSFSLAGKKMGGGREGGMGSERPTFVRCFSGDSSSLRQLSLEHYKVQEKPGERSRVFQGESPPSVRPLLPLLLEERLPSLLLRPPPNRSAFAAAAAVVACIAYILFCSIPGCSR